MRELAVACVLLFAACGNGARPTPSSPKMPAPTTWMLRICNDTPLEIVHLFFSGDSSAELLSNTSLSPDDCTSYVDSDQLHRAFLVSFLVGDDQYSKRSDTPGLLPFGTWSFRIKLGDPAKRDITVATVEDRPPAWTRVCNRTGLAVEQLFFYGAIGIADLAGDCTPYRPALIPDGYPDGEFFVDADQPDGKKTKYMFEHTPPPALAPGRWTFDLRVKDAKALTAELRRNAKPD